MISSRYVTLALVGGIVVGITFTVFMFTAVMGIGHAATYAWDGGRTGQYGGMMGWNSSPDGRQDTSARQSSRGSGDFNQRMLDFMDSYRDQNGNIDVDRMHEDIASGDVESPCGTPAGGEDQGYGGGMMRGYGDMMRGWNY